MTAIQRFGSGLGLNPHLHVLALDGVYTARTEAGGPGIRFHGLPPPETGEVAALLGVVVRRTLRALARAGRLRPSEEGWEVVPRDEMGPSALGACQAASVAGRVALGSRAGLRLVRVGDRVELSEGEWAAGREPGERCAEESGFNLHGDVWVDGQDRRRLERLCRYVLRPAVATERLKRHEDGRIEYGLRRPWRDGTTGFLFEPVELLERLAALVPAPRGHVIRYHGVLAPHARWRKQVVRDRRSFGEPASPGEPVGARREVQGEEDGEELRERRLSWAQLLLRVFLTDVLECRRCGGRRRLIAVVTDPAVIVAFLASVGLPTRAPPLGRALPEEEGEGLEGEPDPVVE